MKIRKTHKMQVLKSILPHIFRSFCLITTFVVVFNGLLALFFDRGAAMYAWGMLIYPFVVLIVASANGLAYVIFEATSRAGEIALHVLQLVLSAVIVFGTIFMLGGSGLSNLLTNALIFILLYQINIWSSVAHQRQFANTINERLKRLREEEATHEG